MYKSAYLKTRINRPNGACIAAGCQNLKLSNSKMNPKPTAFLCRVYIELMHIRGGICHSKGPSDLFGTPKGGSGRNAPTPEGNNGNDISTFNIFMHPNLHIHNYLKILKTMDYYELPFETSRTSSLY